MSRTKRHAALLLALLALPLAVATVRAQAAGGPEGARKFEEFGDVYPTDMAARLDNFAIALQNEPTARAFLVVYRSHRDLPGISSRRVNWMRRHLVDSRGIAPGRVEAIDGGEASCLTHELWIAPPGAPPRARPDAYSRGLDDTDVGRKYDEYFWEAPHDNLISFGTEYSDSLEGYARALHREPRAVAHVILYAAHRVERWEDGDAAGKTRAGMRVSTDPPGTVRRQQASIRRRLARQGVSASRVRVVDGGYRKWRRVELWVVPPGARPPVPTPNVYGPRRGR